MRIRWKSEDPDYWAKTVKRLEKALTRKNDVLYEVLRKLSNADDRDHALITKLEKKEVKLNDQILELKADLEEAQRRLLGS